MHSRLVLSLAAILSLKMEEEFLQWNLVVGHRVSYKPARAGVYLTFSLKGGVGGWFSNTSFARSNVICFEGKAARSRPGRMRCKIGVGVAVVTALGGPGHFYHSPDLLLGE